MGSSGMGLPTWELSPQQMQIPAEGFQVVDSVWDAARRLQT
jgi:hypothetical protein